MYSTVCMLEVLAEQYEHRVDRVVSRDYMLVVLSFSPVVGIGTPQLPHPQASVYPPFGLGGGGGTLARGRWGGGANSDEGTGTVVL